MYGVWCVRNGTGVCGYKAVWAKDAEGKTIELDTLDEAEALAKRLTANLHEKNLTVISYEPRVMN